ncbi:DUF5340 domain-containing protein [Nodosilinea sp. LEGE 07088]|uniref:DUF5340 domain-containing protein n=1 Tax=Nodosilinea sp. LEGE 07088 TaxID=2777968 RepID=UPI001882E3B1|nr:DUF5340 domain-containing protein [Nodosilinea sp. LEGE 07088]
MADMGKPLPLPSHIHYELLLRLLEQQTMAVAYQNPQIRHQVQEVIVALRKALSQQRQLEETCKQAKIDVEYQWSTNQRGDRLVPEDVAP